MTLICVPTRPKHQHRQVRIVESAARRGALAERLEEQRHTFQRDTMLELQDELQRLARITNRVLFQDEKNIRAAGQVYPMPEGWSDEDFQIHIAVQRLQARVLAPDLRKAVDRFVVLCSPVSVRQPRADKDKILAMLDQKRARVALQYTELNELFGERLRRELDRRFLAAEPTYEAAPPRPDARPPIGTSPGGPA